MSLYLRLCSVLFFYYFSNRRIESNIESPWWIPKINCEKQDSPAVFLGYVADSRQPADELRAGVGGGVGGNENSVTVMEF